MLPSRRQYKKWSLPSKWSFWAAVIGIPVGIISLLLTFLQALTSDPVVAERNRVLLQTAHELRYNHEWLSQLTKVMRNRSGGLPTGSLKTDGLLRLIEQHHDWVVQEAYGEEKYIYQHVLKLRDLGMRLGSPASVSALGRTMGTLDYTLDDIHFLNNFLFWCLRPGIVEGLSSTQLYSLGWNGIPSNRFQVPGGALPKMKFFIDGGKPIVEYSTYLGQID